jgi:hypothetical protein
MLAPPRARRWYGGGGWLAAEAGPRPGQGRGTFEVCRCSGIESSFMPAGRRDRRPCSALGLLIVARSCRSGCG